MQFGAERFISIVMISVIIQTDNDETALTRTLNTLVNGAVEGLIGEVIISDAGSKDGTARTADHAGCQIVQGKPIGDVIKMARKDWLLFLEPGAKLTGEWIESVMDHMEISQSPARFSRLPRGDEPFFRRIMSRPKALGSGLLMTKRQASALARAGKTAEQLATGISARKLSAKLQPA